MENNFREFDLRNYPARIQQHGYPAHDPPLAHFSALVNQNQPEIAGINIQISNNSAEEEHNLHGCSSTIEGLALNNGIEPVTSTGILNISIEENRNFLDGAGMLDHSITVGDEVEEEELPVDDPSIMGINDQQTTRLTTPRVAPYVLTMVLSLLGVVSFNLKHEKHTRIHIANPFMLLSVVGFGIAYVTFSILSWVYDHSDYKMLKGLYYIGCNLAFISLLLTLFTTT